MINVAKHLLFIVIFDIILLGDVYGEITRKEWLFCRIKI